LSYTKILDFLNFLNKYSHSKNEKNIIEKYNYFDLKLFKLFEDKLI